MIRTEVVTLTTIPATAYRQKLAKGGSGIVILRADSAQPGLASISKTSGAPIPSANTSSSLYPKAAFSEAIALTTGLPYKKRSAPAAVPVEIPAEPDEPDRAEIIVSGKDYQKIVDAYTDKNGKLSYTLLNKDLIKFAHTSSVAREMIQEKASAKRISSYVIGSKFRKLSGNPNLTDDQIAVISELLDETSPKGVFKEFNEEIRRSLKK